MLAVYWPCLNGAFLWDDIMFVSDNELVKQPGGLYKIWFSTESTDYWPVSYTVFWTWWQFFGAWTLPYHLLAVAIHFGNVLLVERVLIRLGFAGAPFAAFLFALHPVNVESVAWIFQIKTTLSATFALAALWFWLRGRSARDRDTVTASVALLMGLLCKTAIVTWPLALLEATWWRDRSVSPARARALVPMLMLSAVTGLIGLFWYRYGELSGGERVRTDHGLETVLIASRAVWFYLGKSVWPIDLAFIYPRWTIDLGAWPEYLSLFGLAIAWGSSIAAWLARGSRWALALLTYETITLFPVLGFANVYFFRFSFVADHYQYLALIGPAALVGYLSTRLPSAARAAVGTILLIALGTLAHARAAIYVDEATVWRDTLERNPGAWLALYNSGNIAYGQGRAREALEFYERAVAVKGDYVDAIVGLGAASLALGDEPRAKREFERALALFPGHARALNNLAALALNHGDAAAAARYLEDATRFLPDYALGFKNLGLVYMRLGDGDRARRALTRALELRPDESEVKANLERLQLAR